ncbi:O-antigen polymerase [Cellulophaga sp. 2_MG-2023]|nr:O-antigen polymerase [Cellulophaga sp. 2_MG-2023]
MILLIVILFIELFLIKRIVKFYLLSQIHLYLLFYIISISLSVVYYYFYDYKISLFDLDSIQSKFFLEAIKFHILGLVAFCFGVLIYYDFVSKKTKRFFNQSFSKVLFVKYKLPNKINGVLISLFVIIIILYGLTYGSQIFYRETYLIDKSRTLQTLNKLLGFVSTVLLAMLFDKKKLLSILAFLVILIFATGTGSRISFLYLVIYVILIFQSKGDTLRNKITLFANLIVAFFFLSYIMTLRGLESHGIYPYISSLFSAQNKLYDSIKFNVYYSFIFGVFVSAKTMVLNESNWGNIIVSLNPLTGNIAGWYDIAGKMRIYPIVPYSSNGEVFTMGYFFTFIFYSILGCIVAYFDFKTRLFFSMGKRMQGFLVVILFVMYIVYSFEYNLRSSFRYIYYTYILLLFLKLRIRKTKNVN